MYILGLNGPPRSGKDSLALALMDHMDAQGCTIPVRVDYLSKPLRQIAYAMCGGNYEDSMATDGRYEVFKTNQYAPFDRDGRHLMIDVSESFLKPTYGQDICARMLMARHVGYPGLLLVPDCGFQCEVDPIASQIGAHNLVVAQVQRPGYDFATLNDSREWVEHTQMTIVENEEGLDKLRVAAGRLYGRLVNRFGWKL